LQKDPKSYSETNKTNTLKQRFLNENSTI